MPTDAATATTNPSTAEPMLEPITAPMFQAMVRSGIIGEKEPVYLWKGRLARRMAPNRPHSIAVALTGRCLESLLPAGDHVQQEQPVAMLHQHSTPEPDLAVLRGSERDYPDTFPTTADMPLAVEVADSSLSIDHAQADDLAAEGVPVCWILDLRRRRIEVRDDPREGTYRRLTTYAEGDAVPVVVDGDEVGRLRVSDLLP